MFSVKHNQSPPSLPLSKARGPPINTGWLGDLSLRLGREAELNGLRTAGCILMQTWALAWWLHQWPACQAMINLLWGSFEKDHAGSAYRAIVYGTRENLLHECNQNSGIYEWNWFSSTSWSYIFMFLENLTPPPRPKLFYFSKYSVHFCS